MKNKLKYINNLNRKKDVIINSTHDGLISIDKMARIELFNSAAADIMGLNKKDTICKDVREVIPNTRLHIILETGESELNQIQNVGETTIITNRVPVKDRQGEIIGAVSVFRDITEVKKLAEKITNLNEIRGMLEAIINSTQDAISVVDQDGMGMLINPSYTRLTGLTKSDIIGKPATVDIAEGKSMHYKVLKTKKPVKNARMKVGPNKKAVIVNVAPIIVDDELKGSVGVIHDVSEIKKLTQELNEAKRMIRHLKAKYTFADIIAKSDKMKGILKQAKKASQTPVTVLLRGESGTGKELFAHAIHNKSKRKKNKFIRVNCSALADNILESELFGYAEGAFTGSKKGGKIGLFEEADGGTIFLDEIGKISLKLQAKLLRVLQEKEIIRVGSTKTIAIDVRVIVATNTNLENQIKEGEFREDLYYRLNVFPIFIPPLRQRKDDLKPLINHIIRKLNQEYGRSIKTINKDAYQTLFKYNWPGNVRELENIISRSMIYMNLEEEIINKSHLPLLGENSNNTQKSNKLSLEKKSIKNYTLKEIINSTEKNTIMRALEKTDGNRKEAAKLLNIAVRSLYYKIDKYDLE